MDLVGVNGLRNPSGRYFVPPCGIFKQSYDLLGPPRSLPSSDPLVNKRAAHCYRTRLLITVSH